MASAFIAFALSACAVESPARIVESTGPRIGGGSIELVAPQVDATLATQFHKAVTDALQARGYAMQEGAAFVGDVAIAVRPAATGIKGIKQANGEEGATPPLASHQRPQNWYDGCRADRVRATIVVFQRSSGDALYRGSSEADSCAVDTQLVRSLAETLVADLIASPDTPDGD